jgi:hypothetical protein
VAVAKIQAHLRISTLPYRHRIEPETPPICQHGYKITSLLRDSRSGLGDAEWSALHEGPISASCHPPSFPRDLHSLRNLLPCPIILVGVHIRPSHMLFEQPSLTIDAAIVISVYLSTNSAVLNDSYPQTRRGSMIGFQ